MPSVVYLLLAQALYGAGFSIAKDVMPSHISAYSFIVLRVLGATILFGLHYGLFIKERVEKKDFLKFFFCGFFGAGANMLFFFKGVSLTSPVNGALMMLVTPVLVAVIAFFLLKEKLSTQNILGIFISCSCAFLLIYTAQNTHSAAVGYWLGDVYVLLNAAIYAFYLILIKPLTRKYSPITITFYTFVFGNLFVLPFGASGLFAVNWHSFDAAIWLKIAFIIVGITYFTYLFNALAIKKLSTATVGSFIYLQPFMASAFAVFWRNYTISLAQVLLGLGIMLGVYLVSAKKDVFARLKPQKTTD